MKTPVLIVDDDEEIRSQLRWALAEDYELFLAGDRNEALALAAQVRPVAVILDLGLPPHPAEATEGFAALAQLVKEHPGAKIIVATGQSEKANALRAVGEGAYDFLCKPVDIDELKTILRRAQQLAQLETEYHQLQQAAPQDGFEGMLGGSTRMQNVFNAVRRVAGTDAPVLILGESGTGKEVAAKAIHRLSTRKDGSFVAINCGAIPEALLESELFGHEKGSFTGAHMQRKGRVETAAGGTLFLDEIGELPMLLQVKLLRFLQEQVIERIGGRSPIQVDTRVLAATNVNIKKAISSATFREDLYYRLAVVTIDLPPLRDRGDDVLVLAKTFLRKFCAENERPQLSLGQSALRALAQYPWPGNVRELENRIKRAVIMCETRSVTAADLELASCVDESRRQTLKEAREGAEREVILGALARTRWKMAPAAMELDISRPTLYELIAKLGIQKPIQGTDEPA